MIWGSCQIKTTWTYQKHIYQLQADYKVLIFAVIYAHTCSIKIFTKKNLRSYGTGKNIINFGPLKLGIVEIEKFAQGHEKIDLMRQVNILALQDSL